MKIFLQYSFFLVILCGLSSAALKNCATSQCPTGGIWSEWSTTETCPTSCGSCSKIYYTRKCLTSSITGCSCTGSNSKYYPCNTQTCVYPAQRTCCIPYVPMIVGGKSICGPLPKEAEVTSCCPIGGIWSEWTVFVRNENVQGIRFDRTRKCLTADAGCDCTGSDFDTLGGCPCKSFADTTLPDVNRVLRTHSSGTTQRLVKLINPVLDSTTCIYTAEIDTSDTNKDHKDQCNQWKQYKRTAVMRYITPHNKNVSLEERVADCTVAKTTYFQMYCDFKTGNYRYYKNNAEVYAWSQISYDV
ncbi:unnamed protein product [Caenorhabditis brenneri]